jgi:hypothetical protein
MIKARDSIRKYQKIVVLGLALGVITLYMVPIDQILAQNGPGGGLDTARAAFNTAFDNAEDKVLASALDGSDRGYAIIDRLNERQADLNDRFDVLEARLYGIVDRS